MHRLSLFARVLWLVGCGSVVVTATSLLLQMADHLEGVRVRVEANLQVVATSLMPGLQHALVIGDLEAARQMIQDVVAHPTIARARLLHPEDGQTLADAELDSAAAGDAPPAWFAQLAATPPAALRVAVAPGGKAYATLVIEPSLAAVLDESWLVARTTALRFVLLLAAFLTVLAIMLHLGLEPLRALAQRVERFGRGDLATRAPETGPTEIAATAAAFNRMADNMVDLLADVRISERSNRRLALIVEQSQEAILNVDTAGLILSWNAGAERLYGHAPVAAIGSHLDLLAPEPGRNALLDALRDVLAGAGSRQLETQTRARDGRLIDVSASATPLFDDAGESLGAVIMCRDVSELKRSQERLEHLVHHDPLTQLPNRVLLADRLRMAIARAQRGQQMLAVCYLDLDGFKAVNDELGHNAGDQLLVEVATRLQQALRAADTIARLGGDEFALIVSELADLQELHAVLDRVLASLVVPFHVGGRDNRLSASIGVALFPADSGDPDVLLRHADQAMFSAKQAGRNRFQFYDSHKDRLAREQQALFAEVRRGIDRREFVLHYQPKVDMRRGTVLGAEALIRWQHPERGLLAPGAFIGHIEESDLIVELGHWVIDEALRQMSAWQRDGLVLSVSVNVAPRQLAKPDFMERLHGHIERHPELPAGRLELEILESAALDDVAHVAGMVAAADALGVSFALDDFGTGYSSLAYFRRLPAQTLKIDRSFVAEMLDDPGDLAIVEGIIGLTAAFQRQTVAEGVETEEHGAKLIQLGCDVGQGYGIARPMPAAQMPEWARNYRPHPRWQSYLYLHWDRADFPLLVAEAELRRWAADLARAVEADADIEDVVPLDPRHCPFGRWYTHHGRSRYGTFPEFARLDKLHRDLHALGRQAALAHGRGQRAEAGRLVAHIQAARDKAIGSLKGLRMQVAKRRTESEQLARTLG